MIDEFRMPNVLEAQRRISEVINQAGNVALLNDWIAICVELHRLRKEIKTLRAAEVVDDAR